MRKIFGKYTNHGSRNDVVEITSCISSWNNTISLVGRLQEKALEQHWDILFECNFADLRHAFAH